MSGHLACIAEKPCYFLINNRPGVAITSTTLEDQLLSRPVAARKLGCTVPTVQRMIDRGEIPGFRIGGRVMLWESHIREYVERCRITPTAP
ncbi:helix-turn-helix domain-containing protein [Mycobacteroides abscessus]|uniref:helix-turn-helix domain-containing protein n=1 Tax=Mycobacteroides abscessus TaxID=36809 RepID=UPI0009A6936D